FDGRWKIEDGGWKITATAGGGAGSLPSRAGLHHRRGEEIQAVAVPGLLARDEIERRAGLLRERGEAGVVLHGLERMRALGRDLHTGVQGALRVEGALGGGEELARLGG